MDNHNNCVKCQELTEIIIRMKTKVKHYENLLTDMISDINQEMIKFSEIHEFIGVDINGEKVTKITSECGEFTIIESKDINDIPLKDKRIIDKQSNLYKYNKIMSQTAEVGGMWGWTNNLYKLTRLIL